MSLVINELSFIGCCKNQYDAEKAFSSLLEVLKVISEKYGIRIQDIYGKRIDISDNIAMGLPYSQFINMLSDRDSKSILLSLLGNTASFSLSYPNVYIDSRVAYGATFACDNDGVMLSLSSDNKFAKGNVSGVRNNIEVDIRNIAYTDHILEHAERITIRIYKANEKHGKKQYRRSGGKEVADMPLSAGEAQELLNHAVEYKGKLFAEKDGEFYEFPKSIGAYHHGFRRTDLTIDEKKGISKQIRKGR